MQNRYNLYDLEASFKKYLFAENISPVTLKNYLSDVRHFIGWLLSKNIGSDSSLEEILRSTTSEKIINYKEELSSNNIPVKTINRRLSTLRKFFGFLLSQGFVKTNSTDKITNVKKIERDLSTLSPNGSRCRDDKILAKELTRLRSEAGEPSQLIGNKPIFKKYFVYTIIFIIFMSSIGLNFAIRSKSKPMTLAASANLSKGRTLFFSGKLTDTMGNPIATKADVTFQIYNVSFGGSPLYKGACLGEDAVSPDLMGNFISIIGMDCGMSKIPNSIFYENQSLYLGIKIGLDNEMKPRQKIANVEYASNTNLLQGLPIGTASSSIPYINQIGEVLITADSPGIRSTQNEANFAISSANSLTLQSSGLGDVILSATESGSIDFRTNNTSKMYLDNDGRLGIGTTTPEQKLAIAEGDINLDYGYGIKVNNASMTGYYLRGDGSRYSPSLIQPSDLPSSALGFIDDGNIIRLSSPTDKIGIGLTNPDAKLQIINSGLPATGKSLIILDQSEKQNILVASASGAIKMAVTYEGRLGLGMGNPSYQLHLSEDSAAKPTSNTWTVVSDKRLKENIIPFTDGLSILEQINPVNYTLNGKASTPKGAKGIGIIAQDVKNIIPYTISHFKAKQSPNDTQETEFYSFDSSALTFVLINAVKDLNHKIVQATNSINQIVKDQLNNSEKIISPLVETDEIKVNKTARINQIQTNEIKAANENITINLNNSNDSQTENINDQNKGKLSELIIKGLEGKTVTTINAQGDITTEGNVSAKNASISGTLTAQQIESENIKALENKVNNYLSNNPSATEESNFNQNNNVQNLANQINEIQSTLGKIQTNVNNVNTTNELPSIDNQQFNNLAVQQLMVNDNLTVTGKTNLYDASIANSLNIGDLFLNDNSILSLGPELKFSALAKIDFFEGDVIITKGGDITIKGTLTTDNIKTNSIQAASAQFNNITTNQINIDKYLEATTSAAIIAASENFDTNGINAPAIETKTKTVGIGILPAKSNEVIVYNESLTNDSLIYITPTSSTDSKPLYVAGKNTCAQVSSSSDCKKYFTIAIDGNTPSDINFNWWLIN